MNHWSNDLRYANNTKIGQAEPSTTLINLYSIASTAGVILGAYHGYRRNSSVGWAIGWGVLGGLFPFITIPISIAQGFGKRA